MLRRVPGTPSTLYATVSITYRTASAGRNPVTKHTKLPLIVNVPSLLALWDTERNSLLGIYPENLTAGARKVMWWRCTKGLNHSFKSTAPSITRGYGCAVCRGSQVYRGFNDFEYNYPEQSRRWNYIFNDKKPWEVVKSTHKYFWFICDEGHHFRVKLNDIHNSGVWCSYCSGNKIWPGEGKDLATTHPTIAKQLHPDEDIDLYMVGKGSVKQLLWVCPDNGNHTWFSSPNTRTNMGSGCPHCVPKKSRAEIEIFTWIATELLPNYEVIANDTKALKCRKHIDIYIPGLMVGIEYNGNYWHSDKNDPSGVSAWKENRAEEIGIELITIWEDDWKADPDYWEEVIRISIQGALYDSNHSQLLVD